MNVLNGYFSRRLALRQAAVSLRHSVSQPRASRLSTVTHVCGALICTFALICISAYNSIKTLFKLKKIIFTVLIIEESCISITYKA